MAYFFRLKPLLTLLAAATIMAACDSNSVPTAVEDEASEIAAVHTDQALSKAGGSAGEKIKDQYIVVFNDDVVSPAAEAATLASHHGGTILFTYESALKGFAIKVNATAAAALEKNPNVAYVEQDQVMEAVTTQSPVTWGLDRIDQRNLPLSNSYTYDADGSGVVAYIIDTGLDHDHPEYGGRASFGFDAFGGNGEDCHGHGTHVGGTVGSATYGVAKNVGLVSVRVLNCSGSGSSSGVAAGIDYVTAQKNANPSVPMVANMSLGGGFSSTINNAIASSTAAGVVHAVAAGNESTDACVRSPASAPTALTTGSTTSSDSRSSFSNYGTCVDVFAPGSSIQSLYLNGGTATMSGTSMASPHVAGVVALYLDVNPSASVSQVNTAIVDNATSGVVSNPGTGSPNKLLYMGFIGSPGANSPPTADFTFSTSGLQADFTDESTDTDGSIVSWSWDFGDGNTSTSQNPSHTYASATTYSVELTVTDNDGDDDTISKDVTVSEPTPNDPPTADFTFGTTDNVADFTDTSSDTDGSIVSWSWDFGDGNGSSAQNPSHDYAAGGTYTVELTVTDDDGDDDATSQDVTVSDPPPPPPPAEVTKIVLTVNTRGRNYYASGQAYSDFGATVFGDYSLNGSFLNSTSGIVDGSGYALLESSNVKNLSSSDVFTLDITGVSSVTAGVTTCSVSVGQGSATCESDPTPNDPPTADFTFSTTDNVADFTDTSSDTDGSVVSWSWDFGDGNGSTSQNPSHGYAAGGGYTVELTVTDDDGDSDVVSKLVTVSDPLANDPPTAGFTFSTSDNTADFTDTSSDTDGSVVSWSWDFGDGSGSSAQNPSHSYAGAGGYTVELTVTDDDGASDVVSQLVTVTDPPPPPPGPVVTSIVLTVQTKGPKKQVEAQVYAPVGSTISGDYSYNGDFLNSSSDTIGGRGWARLQSDQVQGASDGDVFMLDLNGASGITTCSVSVAQGTNTCQ